MILHARKVTTTVAISWKIEINQIMPIESWYIENVLHTSDGQKLRCSSKIEMIIIWLKLKYLITFWFNSSYLFNCAILIDNSQNYKKSATSKHIYSKNCVNFKSFCIFKNFFEINKTVYLYTFVIYAIIYSYVVVSKK